MKFSVKASQSFAIVAAILLLAGCGSSLKSDDPNEREKAVERTTDQATLAKIAIEDKSFEVQSAALAKLTDQALLAKVADAVGNGYIIHDDAIAKLTDQSLLAKYTKEGQESETRVIAIKNFTDQAALAQFALTDKDEAVRAAAAGRVTDPAVLKKIVLEDQAEGPRLAAVKHITDQDLLAKLAVQEGSQNVDSTLAFAAFMNLTDHDGLQKVADDPDQYEALKEISDVELQGSAAVTKYVEGTADQSLRKMAFTKLTDPEALAQLAVQTQDAGLRLAAEIRLKKLTLDDAVAQAIAGTRKMVDVMGVFKWIDFDDSSSNPENKARDEMCSSCIDKGDSARIPELLQMLDQYGDEGLATEYLNSGQEQLEKAATDWASKNGYEKMYMPSSGSGAAGSPWGNGK